jgi:hypothetical protein
MPQAPEGLVPNVAPSTGGVAGPSPSVPVDAFGGLVGQALQHMGASLEQDSDKIWQRAVEYQNMNNAAEANKGDADFMEQAGLIHAKFNALQGADSQAAYPQYINDLKSLRENVGSRMSNPASRRMYDSQTLSTMSRTIFSGAASAGQQAKVAAIDAAKQSASANVSMATTTKDPGMQEVYRQRAMSKGREVQVLQGETTDDDFSNSDRRVNDQLYSNTLGKQMETDPWGAEEKLEDLAKKNAISGDVYKSLQKQIMTQKRVIGAPNVAEDVYKANLDEDGNLKVPLGELQKQAKDKAAAVAPDDPVFANHAVAAVDAKFHQMTAAVRSFKFDNNDVLYSTMQNKPVTTVQELTASSAEAATAYHNLPAKDQAAWPARINAYNAAKGKAQNEQTMKDIVGLRSNDQESFLNLDPTDTKYGLSATQMNQVRSWQKQDKKQPFDDPRVNRALSWARNAMGAQLDALNIRNYHAAGTANDNADDYNAFTGAVSAALDAFSDAHKRPPANTKEYQDIFTNVLQGHAVKGWLGEYKEPMFKPDTSTPEYKTFSSKVTQDLTNQGKDAPTDAELKSAYVRMQLLKLYPKQTTDGK